MKKYQLRSYQQQAVARILWSLHLDGNSLCVIPTGGGKTWVIAALAKEMNQPILILVPSREILRQDYEKLALLVPQKEIGIYSAGMKQKVIRKFTIATIQSVYRKSAKFAHYGLVIADEADLINFKNADGMFTRFLRNIGNPKIIGMTATPFRICKLGRDKGTGIKLINRMKEYFWQRIIFTISTQELTDQGYLAPLIYYPMKLIESRDIPINKSRTDYDMQLFEEKIASKQEQIRNIISYARRNATKTIVFCSSIAQAEQLAAETNGGEAVSAKTPSKERDRLIAAFQAGKIPIIFNCMLLGIGYDDPTLDCIVLLRPTKSIRLLNQFLGRGTRTSPEKQECLVIDATDSVRTIGRLHTIRVAKVNRKWELISETTSHWHNKTLYTQSYEKPLTLQEKFRRNFSFDLSANGRQIPMEL